MAVDVAGCAVGVVGRALAVDVAGCVIGVAGRALAVNVAGCVIGVAGRALALGEGAVQFRGIRIKKILGSIQTTLKSWKTGI